VQHRAGVSGGGLRVVGRDKRRPKQPQDQHQSDTVDDCHRAHVWVSVNIVAIDLNPLLQRIAALAMESNGTGTLILANRRESGKSRLRKMPAFGCRQGYRASGTNPYIVGRFCVLIG
jgi:hypothetical protein